jgi:serine/threonine protein kinase
LKEHFTELTWNDKFNLALQLACAVSCLHDEGIVHCDLVIDIILLLFKKVINIFNINFYFYNSTPVVYWLIEIQSNYLILGYQEELKNHRMIQSYLA